MADLNFQINVGGNAGEAIGSLKKQLREAQTEVAALSDKFGATSAEAVKAAKRAAELKDRIGDAKALTDAFNPDAKFKALTSSLAGVAGGFAAVQGAISLFGTESKDVEKALLKVQSAMALSQGIQAIGESIDSFKNLGTVIKNSTAFIKLNELANKAAAGAMKLFGVAVETTSTGFKVLKGAIAATGIGLVVVAIGELISAFQSWQSEAERTKAAQDKLNESVSKGAKIGLDSALQSLENQRRLSIAEAKLKGATEKQIFDIEQSYRKLKGQAQVRYWEEIKTADKEGAIKARQEVDKINVDGRVADLEFQAKEIERRKEEARKKREVEEAEAKKLEEGKIRARKAGFDFDMMALDKKDKDKEKAKIDAEEQAKLDEEYLAKQFEIENQVQEVKIQTTERIISENKRRTQADLDAYIAKKDIQLAEIDLLYGISNILREVAGKNKAIQAAAIIAENAAGVGRIIVGTQVANAKAVAASPLTAGQPWVTINTISGSLGVAASLLATRRALSQIGTGGATGDASGLKTSAPIAPQQQPEAQMTQLNAASINALGNQAIKAYVVETDVTSNQQRIKAIQQRARFD